MTGAANTPRLVFGIDAGHQNLLEAGIADGAPPHLAALVRKGSRARRSGDTLPMAHGAWLSLLSGSSRFPHGYHHHRHLEPGSYRLARTTGTAPVGLPFGFFRTDRQVLIVDVPDIDPIEGLAGVHVADLAVHNRERDRASLPAHASSYSAKDTPPTISSGGTNTGPMVTTGHCAQTLGHRGACIAFAVVAVTRRWRTPTGERPLAHGWANGTDWSRTRAVAILR